MRLLLLEDDPTLGEGLRDFVHHHSHRVDWCTTQLLHTGPTVLAPDLALQDLAGQPCHSDGSGMRGLGLMLEDLVAREHGVQTVLPECASGFTIDLHWPAP